MNAASVSVGRRELAGLAQVKWQSDALAGDLRSAFGKRNLMPARLYKSGKKLYASGYGDHQRQRCA